MGSRPVRATESQSRARIASKSKPMTTPNSFLSTRANPNPAFNLTPKRSRLPRVTFGDFAMRPRYWRTALAVVLVLGSASLAKADPADDYAHAFMVRTHAPGVALAVVRNGKVVKEATYGEASLEWHQPVSRTSPFWLDSLTKLFTAVGVMQLAEQGKLSLDDPITKYLTDAPS